MKEMWPASQRQRVVLSFVLFGLAGLLVLFYPAGQGVGNGVQGWLTRWWGADSWVGLWVNVLALLVVAGCLLLLAKLVRSARDNQPYVFMSYVLFLFLVFFALERLVGYAFARMGVDGLGQSLLLQWLSAVIVTAVVAMILPHLRSLIEGQAIALKEHDKFLAAAESSLDDFYIFDGIPDASGAIVDFRFSYLNPNAERRLNLKRAELEGKVLTEVRPFMVQSGLIENYREVVRTGQPFIAEVFLDDDRIKATWINVQVVKLGDGIAITSRDVTERKRLTDHVSYLAHHDQLTGLPNRTLLYDRLRQAILRAQRHQQKIAVFMLDIDNFKQINDTLGHAEGDALLMAVGARLKSSIRDTDTIARMGGDEFVIVMTDFKSMDDVMRCGRQIVGRAAQPIQLGEREITVTVSVGLCLYPECGDDVEELLRKADAAMYVVKGTSRNGLYLYNEGMVGRSLSEIQEDERNDGLGRATEMH